MDKTLDDGVKETKDILRTSVAKGELPKGAKDKVRTTLKQLENQGARTAQTEPVISSNKRSNSPWVSNSETMSNRNLSLGCK